MPSRPASGAPQGEATTKDEYDRKAIEADLMELIERENRWDRELEAPGTSPTSA